MMLRALLLVCVVGVCGAAEVAVSGVSVGRSAAALLGPGTRALDGLITCGSAANIRDVSFEDCGRTPCEAQVGRQYRIEVQFVPSECLPE